MVDRLASFHAIPTFFIGFLAAVEVVIVFATHVSAFWLVPAVLVSGLGVLALFGAMMTLFFVPWLRTLFELGLRTWADRASRRLRA